MNERALDIRYKRRALTEARVTLKYLRIQQGGIFSRDHTEEIEKQQNIIKKLLTENPEYFL